METKKRVIYDEKQLLDHFLQKTIASIFEIPTQGKNGFNTNKVTLENELDKYLTTKITAQDKEFVFSEMNKINARIQDLSVVDLNDPLVFLNEESALNTKKEEIIASRYNIQITASDLKRIQTGNWFNTKIVDFYTYYLSEKLGQKTSHVHMVALPSLFYQPINAQSQNGDVSSNYQEVIELLIKKAEEMKRGEQNIFRITDRMFFVANLIKTHWVIIEVQKAPTVNNKLAHDYAFESMNFRSSWSPNKKPKAKYLIILYDSMANYVKPEENLVLRTMRTFLVYTLGRWGMKVTEDDFELLYAETSKQKNMLESGAYICKFLDILYQKKEPYDSPLLSSIKQLDIEFFKNELKDLIQMIGFKTILPESVVTRF